MRETETTRRLHLDARRQADDALATPAPTVRAEGFARELRVPAPSLRKQAYAAVTLARAALAAAAGDPTASLPVVTVEGTGRLTRTDRVRVASFAGRVLALLPHPTRLVESPDTFSSVSRSGLSRTSRPAGLWVADRSGRALAYRVHPTYRTDAVMDPWMLRLSASDGRAGRSVDGFAGVIIVTPRADSDGLHQTAENVHLLGRCADCVALLTRQGARS